MAANPQQSPIVYRATALPASPNATHEGIWHIKGASDTKYRTYIINSAGVVVEQDAVTAAELALKANDADVVKLTGNQTINGTKTFVTAPVLPSKSTAAGNNPTTPATEAQVFLKANDADVVKLTGNQTVGGIKTFSASPVVPDAVNANQAASKGQMDTADTALQTQITNLQNIVATGTKVPNPIDCSTNPNYPASTKGDAWRVTVGGRIGGAAGPLVEPNDTIYCLTTSASGTEAAVGMNFYIVQGNIDKATTTVYGTVKLATTAEVTAETTANAVPTIADAKTMITNNTKWGSQAW